MPRRLLACLSALACVMLSAPMSAQVRMVSVNTETAEVILRNFGGAEVDLSSWYMCESFGTYRLLNELSPSGSLNLPPGGEVTVTYAGFINPAGQGLGLYDDAFFSLPLGAQHIRDYMQYLTPNGFREPVAIEAGIWPDDDSVDGPGPYLYTGDGSQNGAAFWVTDTGTPVPSLSLPGAFLLMGSVVAYAQRAGRRTS